MPDENLVEDEIVAAEDVAVEDNSTDAEVSTDENKEESIANDDVKTDAPAIDPAPVPGLQGIIVAAIKEAGLGNVSGSAAVIGGQNSYVYASICKIENGFVLDVDGKRKFFTGLDEAIVNTEIELRNAFRA